MVATTGIRLCTGIGFSFAWSGLFRTPRLFRLFAKHCDGVSRQKTSRRRLHISEEKDGPVLSARMGWHSQKPPTSSVDSALHGVTFGIGKSSYWQVMVVPSTKAEKIVAVDSASSACETKPDTLCNRGSRRWAHGRSPCAPPFVQAAVLLLVRLVVRYPFVVSHPFNFLIFSHRELNSAAAS